MQTIWKSNIQSFDNLNSDFECDTAIIGGGIAGLWCAYKLANAGQRVCVLETKQIVSGVTSGSSAILTYAHDIIYDALISKHGEDVAKKYLDDTKSAIKQITKVDCKFEPIDFVLFSTKTAGAKALVKEQEAYKQLGVQIKATQTNLPYDTKYALKFSESFQFNPFELCEALVKAIVEKGGAIFENTTVTESPKENILQVNEFKVKAKNFVVATHYPYIKLPGFYFFKMFQSQNYCFVFNPNNKKFCKGVAYESIDQTGFEYRRVGDNILCDGVPMRVGTKLNKNKYRTIQKHIEKHFGETDEITSFCSQDCITMDSLPYAGKYSATAQNVYVLTGFNKWGFTNSYISSNVVCDMILGKQVENNIYSPSRNSLLISPIKSTKNLWQVIKGLFSFGGKRCSHMGCKLKWNKATKTYDCPCHGSRFDDQGNVINNPACKKLDNIK